MKRRALNGFSGRLQTKEVSRQIESGELCCLASLCPGFTPDLSEFGFTLTQADVTREKMRFLQRNMEEKPVIEFHGNGFFARVLFLHPAQGIKPANSMLMMHEVIAVD